MARKPQYIVSGPGEEKPVDSVNLGLSGATTFACRATKAVTFYVRDARGNTVGYADRDEDGIVLIKRIER